VRGKDVEKGVCGCLNGVAVRMNAYSMAVWLGSVVALKEQQDDLAERGSLFAA